VEIDPTIAKSLYAADTDR